MESTVSKIKNTRFRSKSSKMPLEIMRLEDFLAKHLDMILNKVERLHFYLIIFITEGQGQKHMIDFKEYDFQAGDLLFVAPRQIQRYSADIAGCSGYFLLFTEKIFAKNPVDLDFLHNCAIFDVSVANSVISAHDELFATISREMELIYQEYTATADWATEEMLKRHLSVLLLMAERIKRESQPQVTANDYLSGFYRLKRLLDQQYKANRSVDFYAQEMKVSAKTLNRITQGIIKKSAKEFIDDRVILEAKRLLLHSQLSVKEVGYQLNFDEPTNFVKFFKKHTGVTPVEFKRS